jgi:cell division septation protein DedD
MVWPGAERRSILHPNYCELTAMRWIFFSLFAANLGIFLWWQAAKPQAHAVSHVYATPAGVGSVQLLSEIAHTPTSAAAPSNPENPQAAVDPVAAVSPQDTGATPPTSDPKPADARTQCVLVGPYENNELAQQALQKLQAKEIKAHLYEMELSVPGGYQVYLDGFETRAQAKKRLDELQAGGIDSFIVPKGEFINTIALGSFDQESAAKGQQEKLAAAGVSSKVRESKRPILELWVAMPPEVGDVLPDALRQVLGVGAGEKKREERQILCSTIASGKNIL